MTGLQRQSAHELFEIMEQRASKSQDTGTMGLTFSFFEIYGGRVIDLLNNRSKLIIQEDGRGQIQVSGLAEREVGNEGELLDLIAYGNAARTTHKTAMNEESSR